MNDQDMNYQDILSQIRDDIQTGEAESTAKAPVKDEQLIDASGKETDEYGLREYNRRDELYSDLLDHYIKVYKSKASWNKWYKLAFFVVAMVVFVGLIVGSGLVFWSVLKKEKPTYSDVAIIAGALASILTAILVLPKIIAEHLFPTNEDEHMIGMVKNMQVNDSNIRSNNRGKKSK